MRSISPRSIAASTGSNMGSPTRRSTSMVVGAVAGERSTSTSSPKPQLRVVGDAARERLAQDVRNQRQLNEPRGRHGRPRPQATSSWPVDVAAPVPTQRSEDDARGLFLSMARGRSAVPASDRVITDVVVMTPSRPAGRCSSQQRCSGDALEVPDVGGEVPATEVDEAAVQRRVDADVGDGRGLVWVEAGLRPPRLASLPAAPGSRRSRRCRRR